MHSASLSHDAEKKKTRQIMKEKVILDIKESEIIVRFHGYKDDGGMVAAITVEVVWRTAEARPGVLLWCLIQCIWKDLSSWCCSGPRLHRAGGGWIGRPSPSQDTVSFIHLQRLTKPCFWTWNLLLSWHGNPLQVLWKTSKQKVLP